MRETNAQAQPISFLERHIGKQQNYIKMFIQLLYWQQSTNKMLMCHTFEMQSNTGRYRFIHIKHMKPVFRNQKPFHSEIDVRTVTLVYTEHLNLLNFWQDYHACDSWWICNGYEYWKAAPSKKWFKRPIGLQ